MNDNQRKQLIQERNEIQELLKLFKRAAFRPYDKDNAGDPTVVLNRIHETRMAILNSNVLISTNKEVVDFFDALQIALLEIESQATKLFPEVMDLAIEWQGQPNTSKRRASIQEALGDSYDEAAIFLRNAAIDVYTSPEEARLLLLKLNMEINEQIDTQEKEDPKLKIYLTGPQQGELIDVLLSAYPNSGNFEIMLLTQLDIKMKEISDGKGLKYTYYDVVEAANSQGWVDELIVAARKDRPNNNKVEEFAQKFGLD